MELELNLPRLPLQPLQLRSNMKSRWILAICNNGGGGIFVALPAIPRLSQELANLGLSNVASTPLTDLVEI